MSSDSKSSANSWTGLIVLIAVGLIVGSQFVPADMGRGEMLLVGILALCCIMVVSGHQRRMSRSRRMGPGK